MTGVLLDTVAGSVAGDTRAVAIITLSNPERRNALTVEMMTEVARALRECQADPNVRAVMIRGDGGGFCSGADLNLMKEKASAQDVQARSDAALEAMFDALAACTLPVIAQIDRYCMGAGMALAVGCDIRLAAEGTRFAIPAARMGIGYPVSLAKALTRLVGPGAASDLLLTGRTLTVAEAVDIGLVTHMVGVDELPAQTRHLAETLSRNAPLSMAAAKLAIKAAGCLESEGPAAEAVERANESADAIEGPTAFLEKRSAKFTGE